MQLNIKYPVYNARRYGKPWAAAITFKGIQPVYDFSIGQWLPEDDGSGNLLVETEPGQIIAVGQKDFRGGNSRNDWYLVEAGSVYSSITKQQAIALQVSAPAPAEITFDLSMNVNELLEALV